LSQPSHKNIHTAVELLRNYCAKYGIEPTPEGFKISLNKDWESAIAAIYRGTFNIEEWFESPEKRYKRCSLKFDRILNKHGISKQTYFRRYGHKKSDAISLLFLGQELDLKYWLSKKKQYDKASANEIIQNLCSEKGYTIDKYQLVTRRYLKHFRKFIQSRGVDRVDLIEANWLSVNLAPERDPSNIRKRAMEFIHPGRTHALSQLDFGNNFKSLVKCFYPGGLVKLNADLGLGEAANLPESNSIKIKLESNPYKEQILTLEKQINKINIGLSHRDKLPKLQDELKRLKLLASQHDNSKISLGGQITGSVASIDLTEGQLFSSVKEAFDREPSRAYIYFKRWKIKDVIWFKIGRTNSLERRDKEQNVLPVPSETIKEVELISMEKAIAIESALDIALRGKKIRGAKNKELYQLSGTDYKLVMRCLNMIEKLSKEELATSIAEE